MAAMAHDLQFAEIMGSMSDTAKVITVAVPIDAVRELQSRELAFPLAARRGTALDAVVTVGADAATLVSLMQAPDAIRAFAAWVRDRCTRSGNSIELSVRSGSRRIQLKVDGHIDVRVVANFLTAAMQSDDSQGPPDQ
jgi:hypothetical protein